MTWPTEPRCSLAGSCEPPGLKLVLNQPFIPGSGRHALLVSSNAVALWAAPFAGCPWGALCSQLQRGLLPGALVAPAGAMATMQHGHEVAPKHNLRVAATWSWEQGLQEHIIKQTRGRKCVGCTPEHETTGKALDTVGRDKPGAGWTQLTTSSSIHLIDVYVFETRNESRRSMVVRVARNVTVWVPPENEGRQHVRVLRGEHEPEPQPAGENMLDVVNHFLHVAPYLIGTGKFLALSENGQYYLMCMHYFDPQRHIIITDYDMITKRTTTLAVEEQNVRRHINAAFPVPTRAGVLHMKDTDGTATELDLRRKAQDMAEILLQQGHEEVTD
jgi:hypothetical protein